MVIVQSTLPDLVLVILTILEKYWNVAYAFFINYSPDLEAWQVFSLLVFLKIKISLFRNWKYLILLKPDLPQISKTKQNKKKQKSWSISVSTNYIKKNRMYGSTVASTGLALWSTTIAWVSWAHVTLAKLFVFALPYSSWKITFASQSCC